ncbi:hypothetical protein HELRODRAFT_177914 [Helobdella robusta]|uniref:Hydrogen voltage-gated channel 1 n=1 Tax=Helobdella robusta TaxID=6412 RepID=T1FCG5_HELRO|nr:hypothetical protein HELRODRAFT_177914 [Helobdella robusta]ESN97488.1 hypothetical protein HELRODRAFT_177914 [Helobdella robusta]
MAVDEASVSEDIIEKITTKQRKVSYCDAHERIVGGGRGGGDADDYYPTHSSSDNERMNVVLQRRRKSWMGKKFSNVLIEDGIQSEVVEEIIAEEEKKNRSEDHEKTGCHKAQESVESVIDYTPLQIALLVLALIDVAIVITEIILTLQIYKISEEEISEVLKTTFDSLTGLLELEPMSELTTIVQTINHTCISSGCSSGNSPDSHPKPNSHFVSSDVRSGHSEGEAPSSGDQSEEQHSVGLTSINREGHTHQNPTIEHLEMAEKALNMASIIILGIFVVMAFLRMFAVGLRYFKQYMEGGQTRELFYAVREALFAQLKGYAISENKISKVLDAVVSTLSFILDILKYRDVIESDATEAVIVILLLWQIVRMFNGIMLTELKRREFRIMLLKRMKKRADIRMANCATENRLLQTEVKSLQNLSCRKGATTDEIGMCHPIRISAKPSIKSALSYMAAITIDMSGQSTTKLELASSSKLNRLSNVKSKLSAAVSKRNSANKLDDTGLINLPIFFPDSLPSKLPSHRFATTSYSDDNNNNINNNINDDDDDDDGNVGSYRADGGANACSTMI